LPIFILRSELFQLPGQKPEFVGIGNLTAFQQSTDHNPGGFCLAHFLEYKDIHLLSPMRNLGSCCIIGQGFCVLERQRQIFQAVPRYQY